MKTHKTHKNNTNHKLNYTTKKTTKRYLSTGEAASLLAVTPDAVLKWIKAGKLKAKKTPGGHYRIPRNAVNLILEPEKNGFIKISGDKPFQYCWDFNSENGYLKNACQDCIVYKARTKRCYEIARLSTESGHSRQFCEKSCDDCEYYQLVKEQRPNILVVTSQQQVISTISSNQDTMDYNLGFTNCEYECSALVEKFRPDYVILDCAIGKMRTMEFALHLTTDPRIPLVRIILVGSRNEFPTECDKEVFACIEWPFTLKTLQDLIGSLHDEEINLQLETQEMNHLLYKTRIVET